MAKQHICTTKCYFLGRVWLPGEVFEDIAGTEDKPNKHFAVEGASRPAGSKRPPVVAADDKRSTKKIIADANKLGCKLDKTTSRKDAFHAWKKATDEADAPPAAAAGKGADTPAADAGAGPVDVLKGKKLAECTPDELQGLKNKEIAELILIRFSQDITHGGKKKDDLIKYAVELEEKQVGANAK